MAKPAHSASPQATVIREATFRLSLTDGAPMLTDVSDSVQALLGYPAADFLSGLRSLPSLIHADDRDIADQLFSPAGPGQEGDCNLRLRPAGGRILCLRAHYRSEATADGVILDLRLQDAKTLPRTMAGAATMPNFAAMMENTDDYIYFKDRNHVFTGASQSLMSLCSPAEHWTDLIGQTDYDVFPEPFADLYYRLEKKIFAGLPVAHEVQETLGKDGRKGWVDNRKYPIRDASGAIIGLYGIARDITARMQAEAELLRQAEAVQKSESELRRSQQIAHLGSWHLDVATNQVTWTEELYRMYGADPALPPPPYTEHQKLFTPASWERLSSALAHTRETGTAYELELETVRTDGRHGWMWVRGEAAKDSAGNITFLWGAAQDITARKEAENRARQSHDLLVNLARLVPGVIYQYRLFPDGRSAFPYCSPGMNDIYELTPAEVREDATPVFGRLHPDDYGRVGDLIQESARTLRTFYCEFRVILPRQGQRWRLSHAQPERMEDGGTLWHGIISDITERKQAEAELLASEARAHSIIEASPVPIALNNGSQRITCLNRAFTQTFGYDVKDIPTLNEWWLKAYPDPAYRQEVSEGWQVNMVRKQATGAAFEPMEVAIRCKDGSEKYALASAALLKSNAEEIHLVSLHDITERKQAEAVLRRENASADRMRRALLSAAEDKLQAEAALHETNDRLLAVMENLNEGLVVGDEQGHIVYWNPAALAMHGYTSMDDYHLQLAEFANIFELRLPNDDRPLPIADWPMSRALRGEQLQNCVVTIRRLDQGWEKIITYTGWLIERPGAPKIVFLSITDITERRHAEEKTRQTMVALEEAREVLLRVVEDQRKSAAELRKLWAIIEQAPLSVVITNLRGEIEYVNPRFCHVTGYTVEETIGQNPRILKSGQTPAEVYREMWNTLSRGEVWSGELSNLTKAGEIYLENAIIAPVVDAHGRATHYVALKDDITAKQRHEADLIAKLKREQELSEMKSRFISVTSHEFRTPMAAAMGSVEILANHLDRLAAEKRQALLARINTSLHRMTEMLDEVLLVNRIDANRVEVRLAPIDLQSFVHQTMEEIRLGDRDAHRFEFHVTGVARDFPSDTNLLHHILSNLLSNAVRYSLTGTAITVRLGISAEQAQVTVEDHGIGIPESDHARIFEPFERASNVGTIKGTGLGLNIVQKMTTLLGGNVALTAVEGGGSRFTVTLPRPQLSPPTS